MWMMDEEGEGFDGDRWLDYTRCLREDLIESMVDKAVRERRVWLAAAAELRETEEVKRTGPASPASCLQGRRKGEDAGRWQGWQRTIREDREHREHSEYRPSFGGIRGRTDHTACRWEGQPLRGSRWGPRPRRFGAREGKERGLRQGRKAKRQDRSEEAMDPQAEPRRRGRALWQAVGAVSCGY